MGKIAFYEANSHAQAETDADFQLDERWTLDL